MPLEVEAMLLAFRVAATRFADIRRAIIEVWYITIRCCEGREEDESQRLMRDKMRNNKSHNLSVIGPCS